MSSSPRNSTGSVLQELNSSGHVSSSPHIETNSTPLVSQPEATKAQLLDDRPLSEIIGETFPPFDHRSLVVNPYNDETNQDLTFEQELSATLLDAIIDTHAWSATRPKHESQVAAQKIEGKIVSVMEIEKDQEKTRERLNEFVTRMKTALAALTGLGF